LGTTGEGGRVKVDLKKKTAAQTNNIKEKREEEPGLQGFKKEVI